MSRWRQSADAEYNRGIDFSGSDTLPESILVKVLLLDIFDS
jgi:hypothetical protein